MKNKSSNISDAAVEPETTSPSTDYSDIAFLEQVPTDDWFHETSGPQGQPLVYLRFQATGLLPRLIGPFASREIATWFLDSMLDPITEELEDTFNQREHMVRVPFQRRPDPVQILDPLVHTADKRSKSGTPKKRKAA
ncbi:MAG: hypothetical protein R3B95_19825 [Nitrospirales bacterium]|nr:hypothetical protein [Nitrospirales bacterium]